jgi:hypothetical protein
LRVTAFGGVTLALTFASPVFEPAFLYQRMCGPSWASVTLPFEAVGVIGRSEPSGCSIRTSSPTKPFAPVAARVYESEPRAIPVKGTSSSWFGATSASRSAALVFAAVAVRTSR